MNSVAGAVLGPLALFGAATASAQEARDFATYAPRFSAPRIGADEAPTIDGDLSDRAWAKAAVIEEFYQVEPVEGAAPSQPTKAYVMYDEKYLYVGVYNYDSEPDKIVHRLLERDSRLQDEDAVRVFIDSFGTFRDGYFFGTNPNGARVDALLENNSAFRGEWNTIWNVKSRIVEDGWIAEFAIPFQSISFDASLPEWGFQILRTIRRNNEEIRWSNIDRSRGRTDLTNPGRIGGVTDVEAGLGLEAQLFVTGSGAFDWETGETDAALDPSANIFYKITPSLTGSLTFNTDFSDAPLDARQVNTGRFSLFFPETRDFFLQDAAVFEFGGRVFEDDPNGLPFFSRRIGIVNGAPVDIVAGAKLSGKLGPANVGLISARTGASGAVDGQYLSAARVSVPVLGESKAGIVFTHGDPAGGETNTVGGVDFQYKNSTRFEGTFLADLAYLRSFDGGEDGAMFAGDVSYRSLMWNWTARFEDIGEDYRPRLGFANRTALRRYKANYWRAWRPENSFIRFAETGAWVDVVTDLDDEVEDRFYGAWAMAANDAGDEASVEIEHGFLDIREPFDIAGVVPVPVGEYRFTQYEASVSLTSARPVGGRAEVRWGDVYNGDYLSTEFGLNLTPSMHFRFAAAYEYTKFSLPTGAVGIHVGSIDSTVAFSPTMILRTDLQYDNISENFTFFSRFSWEPKPHQEVFISFGHTALIEEERFPQSFRAQGTSLALRLGHTLRF
ncbi:MAG: carbohydrate binding family 9 domain-containing protein [Parvularculaceae bacterium]